MGVTKMMSDVRKAMMNRIENEGRAMRGKLRSGFLQVGSKSYPVAQAVDVNVADRGRVWAMRARNGKAVIVGQ